jgi:hypothetical protein
MRLPFLLLLALAIPLAHSSTVRADEVESQEEYIVGGEPVGREDAHGTVGLLLLDDDTAVDDLTPSSIPNYLRCSGVLIAPTVVLTASHCLDRCVDKPLCDDGDGRLLPCEPCEVEPRARHTVRVVAGLNTVDDLWHAEVLPVHEVFLHEGYRAWPNWAVTLGTCQPVGEDPSAPWICDEPGLGTDIHDIAILRLDAPVTAVGPVALLPTTDIAEHTVGIAQGYGQRLPEGSDSLLSQEQYVSLLNEAQTPIERTTEQEILTTEGSNHSGTCFGDSGGPLYVRQGQGLFVAGVAVRARNDRSPVCGGGSIHTLAPAYADWIYQKAPEAIPFRVSGGGGCSAAPGRSPRSTTLLFVIPLLLLCFRPRRTALLASVLAVIAAPSSGCGSDSGASDVSFCTEEYDPLDLYCSQSDALDLQTAEAVARLAVPDDAWLWIVLSDNNGSVGPDGRATKWFFSYLLPERRELPEAEGLNVIVIASQTFVTPASGEVANCIPSRPINPLDSRRLIHDAIALLEAEGHPVVLDGTAALEIIHGHDCAWDSTFSNYVMFRDLAVYFDERGTVLGIVPREAAFDF